MVPCWRVERYSIEDNVLEVEFSCLARSTNILDVLRASLGGVDARTFDDRIDRNYQQIQLAGPVDDRRLHGLMAVLEEVVSVCDVCDLSECLGFYRNPEHPDQSPDDWAYTEVGQLVHAAKYESDAAAGG